MRQAKPAQPPAPAPPCFAAPKIAPTCFGRVQKRVLLLVRKWDPPELAVVRWLLVAAVGSGCWRRLFAAAVGAGCWGADSLIPLSAAH